MDATVAKIANAVDSSTRWTNSSKLTELSSIAKLALMVNSYMEA